MELMPLVAAEPTISPRRARVRSWSLVSAGGVGVLAIAGSAAVHAPARGAVDGANLGVPVIAMAAIIVSVMRWMPAEDLDVVRPVPSALVCGSLGAALPLWLVVVTQSDRSDVLFGPLVTAALVAVYLACWGFRSLFLLRRVVLLSTLAWEPVASGTHEIVRNSVQQLSDLIYRRLAAVGWLGVEDQPWRWFSAMTHRGALVVIGTIVLGVAASRRRLSTQSCGEVAGATFLAMVVHHAIVLGSPLDRYDRPWIAHVVAGPAMELVVAAGAASVLALVRSRRTASHTEGPSPALADRDPVIFGVEGAGSPAVTLRAAALATSVVLVASAVVLR